VVLVRENRSETENTAVSSIKAGFGAKLCQGKHKKWNNGPLGQRPHVLRGLRTRKLLGGKGDGGGVSKIRSTKKKGYRETKKGQGKRRLDFLSTKGNFPKMERTEDLHAFSEQEKLRKKRGAGSMI